MRGRVSALLALLALLVLAALPADALTVTGHVSLGGAVAIKGAAAAPSTSFRAAWPIAYSTVTNGGTPTVYTRAQFFPSDVTSVTPKIRNAYQSGGVGSPITSNVALYMSDGTGAATGSALNTWLAQVIPGDGTDWSGGATAVTLGSDGKLVMPMSLAASALVSCAVSGLTHGVYNSGTSTVNPAPSGGASDPQPIGWVHFDYSTSKRKLVFIGDSISVGTYAVTGFEISFPYKLGVIKNYAVEQLGLPGSSLQQWSAYGTTSAAWWADGIFNSSVSVWIQVGVNDIAGLSATAMEGYITLIVNHFRNDLGVTTVYANTLAPDGSVSESTRLAYNAWLLANSLSLTGVADFAAKQNVGGMADNSNSAILYAPYDVGDGLHWTDAGHIQAETLAQSIVM